MKPNVYSLKWFFCLLWFSFFFSFSISSLLSSVVSISTCCDNTFAQTQFSVTEIYNSICLRDKVYCLAFLTLVRGKKKEKKNEKEKSPSKAIRFRFIFWEKMKARNGCWWKWRNRWEAKARIFIEKWNDNKIKSVSISWFAKRKYCFVFLSLSFAEMHAHPPNFMHACLQSS